MKQSEVRPGMPAMLTTGRNGSARAVTVEYERYWEGRREWVCVDSTGVYRTATARQLRPVPVTSTTGALLGYLGSDGGLYPTTAAGWAHVGGR